MSALTGLLWLAAAVQDPTPLEQAIGTFDEKIETADKAGRLALVRAFAAWDQPGSADRVAKTFALVEGWLGLVLPEVDPQTLPLLNPLNLRLVVLWRGFSDKTPEEQTKIRDIEEVRAAAMSTLRAYRSPATIGWMLDVLKAHSAAAVREGMAQTLGGVDDERISAALIDRVRKDDSWRVRAAAVEALAARKSKEGIDALKGAVAAPEWQVRYAAVDAITKMADPQLTPALVRALRDARWEIRGLAISGIAASRDRSTVPALLQSLKDEAASVRAAALVVLGGFGTSNILPALSPLLSDEVKEVRGYAVEAIEQAGGRQAIRALAAALASPHEDVRAASVEAIERIGHKLAVSPLLAAYKTAPDALKSRLLAAVAKLTGVEKKDAREWQTWWDGEYRRAVGEFDGQFSGADAARRVALVQALSPFDRKEVVDRLLKVLDQTERVLRMHWMAKDQLLKEQQTIPDILQPNGSFNTNAEKLWDAYYKKQSELQTRIYEQEAARAYAVDALGGFSQPESVDLMVKRLAKAQSPLEREALAHAMGGADPAQVVDALIERLQKDKEWTVRVAAIDSLLALRAEKALDSLKEAMGDAVWHVQLASMQAVEQIAGPRAVPLLIDALEKAEGRWKWELLDALTRLTGLERSTHPGWKAWWAANGDNFLAGRARDDSAGTETAEPPRLPTFYGFTVTSKRVVFIMDRSTSMESQTTYKPAGGKPGQDKPEGNQLFHIARFELRTVIRMLPEDTLFNVVMFSDGTRVWQPTLVPASRANREAAVAWIQATPPSGNTNTFDALETAFQIRGPSSDKRREQGADTIFLVSDGIPTVGRLIDPNMILMELGRMNRTRRVRVNTVAIGDALAGTDADFLKKMAEQNQGSFAWRK